MYNAIIKEERGCMKKPKKSEKLLLEEISVASKALLKHQRGLEVGQLITLIRNQLRMSQRALARRAGVPQATVSRIESCHLEPNTATLNKIADAMECDLCIIIVPRSNLEAIRNKQAQIKAEKKIRYLHGTMSLEKQSPSPKLLQELIKDEVQNLLESSGSALWEEG